MKFFLTLSMDSAVLLAGVVVVAFGNVKA